MKRHPRTKVQVLAVAATAVALGMSASPAHAADLNLGNLAKVKVLGGDGNVADVQVPGLNTGATVDTKNGANVKLNLGTGSDGSGGTDVNVNVGGQNETTSTPSEPTYVPGVPSSPSTPTKGKTTKTVKKVVRHLAVNNSGKGSGRGSGSSSGGTGTIIVNSYGTTSSGRSGSVKAGARVGGRAGVGTTYAGTGSTQTAGDGTSSSTLASGGDRLTNGGGHSAMFWAFWLVLAGLLGAAITFVATRWRRRRQEDLLDQRTAALGEELAVGTDRDHKEEKELVAAVPGLAPSHHRDRAL